MRRLTVPKGWPRNSGLTLIETLIVLVVIGILATLATPSLLNWLTQNRIDQATTRIMSALEVTQREAMRQGKVCTLEIPDGNQISGDCLPTGTIHLANNIQIKSNLTGQQVRFGFRGNTTDGGTIVVYATDSNAAAQCVVTSIGIGMIREGYYMGDINAFDSNQCQSSR
jgi:prepilin-type N-terminal cleavage/methylation domain-containing protein